MSTYKKICIIREEYFEIGPSIVITKCCYYKYISIKTGTYIIMKMKMIFNKIVQTDCCFLYFIIYVICTEWTHNIPHVFCNYFVVKISASCLSLILKLHHYDESGSNIVMRKCF